MRRERRQELKQDEFVDTLVWLWATFKLHQSEIATGIVVALVLVGLGMYVVPRWRHANDQAWTTLSVLEESQAMARSGMEGKPVEPPSAEVQKYEKLAADYPRSGAAPLALYKAAKLLHDAGKLDEALKELGQLLNSYPSSEVAPAAEAAKASVLEDQGKFAEAKSLYEGLAKKVAGAKAGPGYMAPRYYLNAGRCAELTKDAAQAKTFYDKTITLAPGTPWAQLAEERLKDLGKPGPVSAPKAASEKKG